jgi:serine/threonine protein kinase
MARFRTEARALAALNHPNIAVIHGLVELGDGHAIVMELVEGPTLADRLTRGTLPTDEAVAITSQIVAALAAAHDRGIIHRDLKPANEGEGRRHGETAHFGLAKLVASPDDETRLAVAHDRLRAGDGQPALHVAGADAGEPIDARTDLFCGRPALRAVTGKHAFPP